MKRTDEDILRLVARGSNEAFDDLYARLAEPVRRRVHRIVRSAATADDLVQECFLRIWRNAGQWDGRGSAEAWISRIATNLALNHLRSAKRRRQRPLHPTPGPSEDEGADRLPSWMTDTVSLGPDAVLERAERADHLRQAIADLPEAKREVIRMVYDEEMDVRSAARALGIPAGTVKSRLYHARRALNEKLRPELEDGS